MVLKLFNKNNKTNSSAIPFRLPFCNNYVIALSEKQTKPRPSQIKNVLETKFTVILLALSTNKIVEKKPATPLAVPTDMALYGIPLEFIHMNEVVSFNPRKTEIFFFKKDHTGQLTS